MSTEMGGSGFCTGLVIGAALGAATALLLAPRSGREVRESMLEEGRSLREKASGKAADLRERGEAAYEKTRETLKETTEGLKEAGRALTRG